MTKETIRLQIVDIIQEAPLVKTFRLLPLDNSISYKTGQFLTFITTIHHKEFRRSYSLSSVPGLDALPSITLKRVPNGYFSRKLIDDAVIGDILIANGGATGIFTLPDNVDSYAAVWLFAAGIGITPVFSILRSVLRDTKCKVVLVYSNRNQAETVFYDAIRQLERDFAERLTVVWLWSNDKDVLLARFSKESFPIIHQRHLKTDVQSVLAYVCGPTDYMWLVQLLLQDIGMPKAAVRREVFQFEKDIPKALPPDQLPHKVTIQTKEGVHTFTNIYPESILLSARAAGINLPYSCEAGQCGSCTATCTKGEVWMSYNEVLTDKDIQEGRILTCTGHAVGGDITLDV